MKDMKIRAGSRLSFAVERADPEAVGATFLAVSGSTTITDTVSYNADGVAYFIFGSPETDTVGIYDYQVSENFANSSPDIYPSVDDCDGDCDFPQLEICTSLTEGS